MAKANINWHDIEIICGQDGLYWLYSNTRDKYYATKYHWRYMTQDDLIARINLEDGIDNRCWQKDLPFS